MLDVHALLQRRALVTRESAQRLREAIRQGISMENAEGLVLNFEGVEAVTPSFIDETLGIICEIAEEIEVRPIHIRFQSAPTRLSSKFLAIGRARGLEIAESPSGSWSILQPA